MTLVEMLAGSSQKYPDKVVFNFKQQNWTYQDFEEQSNKVANGLKNMGIGKGDRVGLMMLNNPYFVISYFAIVKLGATVVPVNVMFKGAELQYLLNDSQAAALITSSMFVPLVSEIREKMETIKNIVVLDAPEDINVRGYVSLNDILANESAALRLDYSVEDEDVAVFLYTSGTTGNPKGAMLTHRNLVSNAAATAEASEAGPEDTTICVLPMFHSFALTVCINTPIYSGGTIIVLESFSPQAVLNAFIEQKATIFAGVPTMYTVLLQLPNINPADFAHVRVPWSGGASLPVEVLKAVNEKFGINILEGYGLSEASPVCALNPLHGTRKAGSIGKTLPGVECMIVDEKGNELPANTPGELLFRGPNIMKGYFNLPEATTEALKNGWLHTGDIGYVDDEGYIFLIDRKKDLIIVGGLNVYPREIEEVLYSNPKVAEAAVIGVPDALRGEMVKAYIALKQGETASEREIIKFCQERIANYKLPKSVEFLDALPKTSTGKILKRALKG